MAMLKLLLAITIVSNMSKMDILAILAMAICVTNMATLGIQLKSIKKLAQLIHINWTFRSDIINIFVIM